jgi:DNA repair protein RadC
MYFAIIMRVKLSQAQKIQIINSFDIFKIMQHVLLRENKLSRSKEHFWLVCLSHSHQILLIELISLGKGNAVIVDPADIFSFALQKKATKIVLVHNHPSGNLEPSLSDIKTTDRMQAIGDFIQMPILDHLIITEEAFYSFADTGLLDKIVNESRFDLHFEKADKLLTDMKKLQRQNKTEIKKIKKETAEAKEKEIAIKMLAKGYKPERISEITGLSEAEIKKLPPFAQ